MVVLPETELRALGRPANLQSLRVLELGNKKNSTGLYREWYEAQGAGYICADINGLDGAIPWDIRDAPPKEIAALPPFDIVTNFGFTEHVQDDQEACWRNIHALVHPNYGQLSCVLPAPGSWRRHGIPSGYPGRWYPHPAFFVEFARNNGYVIDDLWVRLKEGKDLVCCSMHRVPNFAGTFKFSDTYLYDNVNDVPALPKLIKLHWTGETKPC